jgi:hypothetical protein
MRASQKRRNGGAAIAPLSTLLPDDIKASIGDIVRSFLLTSGRLNGTCVYRAVIADGVFKSLGLPARLITGGLMYRAGFHRERDVIRFALPNNLGGYHPDGWLCGHVWHQLDGEIIDFSSGDWVAESEALALADLGASDLGFVEWEVEPPSYIWQSARSLTAKWKAHGVPQLGDAWYCGWGSRRPPADYLSHEVRMVTATLPYVENLILETKLCERIAEFRHVEMEDAA